MKNIVIYFCIGYFSSMGLRTVHSVLCNHYFNQCNDEHEVKTEDGYNPVQCMDEKMGYLNFLSKIAGFPMLFFDKWQWEG